MITANATSVGTIVWYDLMTTDIARAKSFYADLLPEWNYFTVSVTPDMNYDIIRIGDVQTGGLIGMAPTAGIPSHWMQYVSVENIDRTLALAEEHGGKVLEPVIPCPGVGKFAMIQDPTGAIIKPFEMECVSVLPSRPMTGMFCWTELYSSDIDVAKEFYSNVFGWKLGSHDFGPNGTYTMFLAGEHPVAGGMTTPHGMNVPSHWQSYIMVPNVDARTEKAIGLGAKLLGGPIDVPSVGRMTFLIDPTGAMFALHTFATDVAPC